MSQPQFTLKQRNGIFYITWLVGRSEQKKSLKTRDQAEANEAFAKHLLTHGRETNISPAKITIANVVRAYWENVGKHKKSKDSIRSAKNVVEAVLPFATVEAMSKPLLQAKDGTKHTGYEVLVNAMRERGNKDNTINRNLGVVMAALNYARKRGELTRDTMPVLSKIEGAVDDETRTVPYTGEELRRVFRAAHHEHQRLFLVLQLVLCARPISIIELDWAQVDFDLNVIHLAKPGVNHGKKKRPTLPMTPTLRAYLEPRRSTGRVIKWEDEGLASHRTMFERIAADACVAPTAYSIRKSTATWLRQHGVSELHVKTYLGHTSGTMDRYAWQRPDYLKDARNAIEALLADIDAPWLPPSKSKSPTAAANESMFDLADRFGRIAANG